MLRITRVEDTVTILHLRLEGRIVGDWVQLLAAELAQPSQSKRAIQVDLIGVAFANDAALSLLRGALGAGVRLVNCPPLIGALLGSSQDGS